MSDVERIADAIGNGYTCRPGPHSKDCSKPVGLDDEVCRCGCSYFYGGPSDIVGSRQACIVNYRWVNETLKTAEAIEGVRRPLSPDPYNTMRPDEKG